MQQKVLMIIPNLDFGGAQRVFHTHARFLAEGFEVIECSFNLENSPAFPTKNQLVSLDVPAGTTFIDKIYRFTQRCWRLYKLKREERPVMTISHLEGADYVNVLSLGKGKIILVIHGSKVHDEEMNSSYGWLRKRLLLPFLYRRASLIVTVSEGIRQELINTFKLPAEKIVTIYNSFDTLTLKKLAAQVSGLALEKSGKTIKLVTSGRLALPKNQLSLLHIIKVLKDESKVRVQLFFIGEGPLKNSLVVEATKIGLTTAEIGGGGHDLQQDILFLGYQQNPFKFYKEMDIFLFPSAWEGFPMALGEAMALGLPVLASDCPPAGPRELLLPDWEKEIPILNYPKYCPNGILLPIPKIENPDSIQLWAETISRVIQDNVLRSKMRESAQRRMKLLDHELVKDKWLNIHQLLV